MQFVALGILLIMNNTLSWYVVFQHYFLLAFLKDFCILMILLFCNALQYYQQIILNTKNWNIVVFNQRSASSRFTIPYCPILIGNIQYKWLPPLLPLSLQPLPERKSTVILAADWPLQWVKDSSVKKLYIHFNMGSV